MRLIVPLAAGFVLLAPMTGLAQEQQLGREPVVGLYEHPVPEPARAVYEENPDDAEPAADGYEMFENEGEEDYPDEGVELNASDDIDLIDVIEREAGLMADNGTASVKFFYRELPNGLYEWGVVEYRKLANGETETVVTSRDEEGFFDEVHILNTREEESSLLENDEEIMPESALE